MNQTIRLPENIRTYREKKGISQTRLAAILQISPQSVSKWERGLAAPDIENLYLLAKALNVSVDALLDSGESREQCMIGIDGGGTKTEFVVFTENGAVLDRLLLGGSNPNAVGIEESALLLQNGIDQMISKHGKVRGVFVGASGFLTGGNGKVIEKLLKERYPNMLLRCETDIRNVIASGTDEDNCIAAICGTGSVVYAKVGDTLNRLTGWGYLLSQRGSGYDIGRAALQAALSDTEGLGESTGITALVEARLNGPVSGCIREVYCHDQSYIASFAPLVFAAWEQGDVVAQRILEENARALADVINHAAKSYPCGDRVIISGGLITGNERFRELVQKNLHPGLTMVVPQLPQVLGACRLCAKMCGAELNNMEKLETEYKKRG